VTPKISCVRAKFRLNAIKTYADGLSKTYCFSASYDPTIPEDIRFQKASPYGSFEITIDNPTAQEFFELGKPYYFDAVPVPVPVPASN